MKFSEKYSALKCEIQNVKKKNQNSKNGNDIKYCFVITSRGGGDRFMIFLYFVKLPIILFQLVMIKIGLGLEVSQDSSCKNKTKPIPKLQDQN